MTYKRNPRNVTFCMLALALTGLISLIDLAGYPALASNPMGLISKWSAEGNANDSAAGNHGTLMGNATFAPGKCGQMAFSFDGDGDYVLIEDSPNLSPSTEITISTWLTATPTGDYQFLVSKFNGNNGPPGTPPMTPTPCTWIPVARLSGRWRPGLRVAQWLITYCMRRQQF